MAAVGAFYLLSKQHLSRARIFVACRRDRRADLQRVADRVPRATARDALAAHQPVTLAAMEALWDTQPGAPLVIIGQPDVERRRSTTQSSFPRCSASLTWRDWSADSERPERGSQQDWPDNISLLYYAYHIMVGLGTIFMRDP